MSKLFIITADMHKVAEFCVNIKYRRPGNVVKYLPVKFEVFIDGENYKAVPLQSLEMRMLTNLPCELTFQIRNGKAYNYSRGAEEIIDSIVSKLAEMDIEEIAQKRIEKTMDMSPTFLDC